MGRELNSMLARARACRVEQNNVFHIVLFIRTDFTIFVMFFLMPELVFLSPTIYVGVFFF